MPKIRPYLPFPKDFTLIFPVHNSASLAFAANPSFFSAKFLVRDSGVSICANLTLCLCSLTSKPRSRQQSNVSPSTILSNVAL